MLSDEGVEGGGSGEGLDWVMLANEGYHSYHSVIHLHDVMVEYVIHSYRQ